MRESSYLPKDWLNIECLKTKEMIQDSLGATFLGPAHSILSIHFHMLVLKKRTHERIEDKRQKVRQGIEIV